jgi:O-antigen/teichoic acid export membrane protein
MTGPGRARGAGAQASALALATGVSQVLVAVIYVLAARDAEPAGFGLVVAALGLGTAAVGFIDFGTNSYWIRERARGVLTPHDLRRRTAAKLLIALVIGIAWTATTALVVPDSLVWMAGPIMFGVLLNQTLQVPLRAAARAELVALCVLGDRVVASAVFLGLLALDAGAVDVLWVSLFVGSLVSSVVLVLLTPRDQRVTARDARVMNPWRGAGYFGVSTLATSAQSLDVTLLTIVAGPVPAGVFGAVSRWTQPMGLLAASFSSVIAPFVARAASLNAAWSQLRRAIWMPLGAIVASAVVFILAPFLVPLLLGPAYSGSIDVLRVLSLAAMASIVSQPIMVVLQALGRDRFAGGAIAGAVVLQLALILLLAPNLGALGAAIAAAVIQYVLVVSLITGLWHEMRRIKRTGDAHGRDDEDGLRP